MEIYCLRHGLAVDLETQGFLNDAERTLTAEGERKLRGIIKWMQAMELSFDWILFSPYVRTRQTADLVARGLDARDRLKPADCLAPGGTTRQVVHALRHLAPAPKKVLLVGHEPGLSELVSLLVTGNIGLGMVLKKGGLCKLTVASLNPSQCAVLEWLVTPRQMIGPT